MDYISANSECSSGCESGWTLYLENSFLSSYKGNGFVGGKCGFSEEKRIEEEEDDLSMVSDASSGPPHFPEEEDYLSSNNGCLYHASHEATLPKNTGKKQKLTENHRRKVHERPSNSLLDDTASSSVFNLPNKNWANHHAPEETVLEFSQGYSTTHFEGSSAYQDQYGFLHSSLSGNYLQKNQMFWKQEVAAVT